jgi:hypothetical protein
MRRATRSGINAQRLLDSPTLRTVPPHLRREAGFLIATIGLLAILALTLSPAPWREGHVSYLCLICGDYGGQDVADNLLLFIPFALGLGLAGVPFRTTMVAAIGTTVFVEGLQAFLIPGRDASLSDLLTNSLGGAAGWQLAKSFGWILLPTAQAARRRSILWGVVPVLASVLGAWFVQPSWPPGPWYGRVKPPLPESVRFEGSLLSANLGDAPFWTFRHPRTETLRRRLTKQPWTLTGTVVTGSTPKRFAPILGVFDGTGHKVVLLGQLRTRALFSPSSVSERLRFRPLVLTLPDALPGSPGDTVTVTGRFGEGQIGLEAGSGSVIRSRTIALSPSLLWAFSLPLNDPLGSLRIPGTVVWLLLLYLPLGWWGARAADPKLLAVVPTIAAVIGLLIVPRVAGLPAVPPWEWLAAVAGVLTGTIGARAVRGRF